MTSNEIKAVINKYDIRLVTSGDNAGKLEICNYQQGNIEKEIVPNKEEIKSYLQDEPARQQKRKAKIAAIEGLEEIIEAQYKLENYREAFEKMMDDEYNNGVLPKRPDVDIDAIKTHYPRATAYLKAESWSYAYNQAKSSAGSKALERIIDGEDYNTVIAEMEKEWADYCDEHMWD